MQDIHHSAQGYVFLMEEITIRMAEGLPVLNDYFTQGLGINEINLKYTRSQSRQLSYISYMITQEVNTTRSHGFSH